MGDLPRLTDPEGAGSPERSDQLLWALTARDDKAAFEALFQRHSQAVWNHSYRLTGSWEQAEDVTSNTFLVAWRRRGSVMLTNDSARPWLYAVAGNLARDINRGTVRRTRLLRRLRPPDDAIDHADSVVSRISDAAEVRQLLDELRELPLAQRRAVELCLIGELSMPEAAAVLGVNEVTVRSNLSRARTRLRRSVQSIRDEREVPS